MDIEARKQYQNFEEKTDLPIFFRTWWLDTVCAKGTWDICISKDKAGNITGILPYYLTSFLRFKVIRMPPFTPYLGVFLTERANSGRNYSKYSFENNAINSLIEQLPKVAYYHQIHPDQLENWLPFFWKGYRETTRYTYVFEELDLEKIYSGMKDKVRNVLRKAENIGLSVREENNLEKFLFIQQKTFARQRISHCRDAAIFRTLHEEIYRRGHGAIYFAEDEKGEVHAALYLIWDAETAYCWQIGSDTELRKSGAVQLLIWHSIQEASKIVKRYNFEGSMLPHIEPVFRAFGSERKPVFQIRKFGNRFLEALWVLLKS